MCSRDRTYHVLPTLPALGQPSALTRGRRGVMRSAVCWVGRRVRGPDGRSFMGAVRHARGLPRDQSRVRRRARGAPALPRNARVCHLSAGRDHRARHLRVCGASGARRDRRRHGNVISTAATLAPRLTDRYMSGALSSPSSPISRWPTDSGTICTSTSATAAVSAGGTKGT
jgi:hypothetical protein